MVKANKSCSYCGSAMHDLHFTIEANTTLSEGSGLRLNNLGQVQLPKPGESFDLDMFQMKTVPNWVNALKAPHKNGHRILYFIILVALGSVALISLPHNQIIFGSACIASMLVFMLLLFDPFYDEEDWKFKMQIYQRLLCCSNCKMVVDTFGGQKMQSNQVPSYIEYVFQETKDKDKDKK